MPSLRVMGDLVVKVIVWNIWLVRNDCIFNAYVIPIQSLYVKINRILLSWFSAASDGVKEKIEGSMLIVQWSLEFTNALVEETGGEPSSEEVADHGAG